MKRLYIGGLAHTISQKDLKDRFGKFGEVSSVEIITRKDGTGIPVKTFGYININISDEALRKCITVLNKSKWKGGTLQIEMAKESFLHRLAVERQQATEKTQSPKIEHKETLMESFTKAGVENFHMKAAVPGTEIPGYKDAPVASKGKHIVFDCDDESEEEAEPHVEPYDPTKSLFEESPEPSIDVRCEGGPRAEAKQDLRVKDFQKQGHGKLFCSSEEEEEEEAEDDEARFQIKPQYEGKAGQKLMKLQSRFGTDERFHMDSRFLESDDESNIPEEASSHSGVELQLQEEKKKNLDILQSLLNINVSSTETSKEAAKTKAFRDISALHYDPTRLEHAAFEKKSEEPKKESKAARRKKREEAEKLPEVSKKIYYDVAVDLKEVFGSQKESPVVKPAAAWDKEEEDQEKGKEKQATVEDTFVPHTIFSSNVSNENAESTGFQFSFFGKETAEDITAKDEYKIEILKKTKVLWQPFGTGIHDSSSEEEEVDKEEQGTGDQSAPASTAEEQVTAKKTFFFYFQDDERLKVGPKMFCSSAELKDQVAHWEEKRTFLIEEYRKRHKDARRRLKTSQKS
ncbi:hypothetical protein AAFF_G00392430 [Aldrovandia affinis]|uniref:Nucleolar protein 8 n=1 Tax=Aldrovandia affinis TaxID=143900 RepID=A0AAD7WLX3_9TELE|nr:hypothetical protein AAFF_G00392430 [Aldrovandia affinis]